MERRRDDPVINAIHKRLDKLEEMQASLHRIEEWIATVVRMNMIIEVVGDFLMRWAKRVMWVGGGVVAIGAAFKYGTLEFFNYARSMFR